MADLCVQVEEHFHVVRNETYGHDNDVSDFGFLQPFFDEVADVWLEPRWLWRAAAALINESPIVSPDSLRYQSTGLAELFFVSAVFRHRHGDAVRGEHQFCANAAITGDFLERTSSVLDHRFNETRVIEKHAELVDCRCASTDF